MLLSCFSAKKIKSVRVAGASEGLALCPGQHTPITVRARTTKGQVRTTDGRGRSGLRWDEVVVRLNGQNFEQGSVWLPAHPNDSMGQTFTLEVFLKDRPEVASTTTVTPRYDCSFVADFSGRPGEDGRDDRFFERTGWDGVDGGHGQPGGSATAYAVAVEGADGRTLLQVRVSGKRNGEDRRDLFFLVDPAGGQLTVDVRGGVGGAGEAGHEGDDGDDGPERDDGTQDRGDDGEHGGDGGDGGDGGPGGSGFVVLDAGAQKYAGHIVVDSRGGDGGLAGDGGDGGDGGDPDGDWGDDGRAGRDGRQGQDGPEGEVTIGEVHRQF